VENSPFSLCSVLFDVFFEGKAQTEVFSEWKALAKVLLLGVLLSCNLLYDIYDIPIDIPLIPI
jgi:hypothetical protein